MTPRDDERRKELAHSIALVLYPPTKYCTDNAARCNAEVLILEVLARAEQAETPRAAEPANNRLAGEGGIIKFDTESIESRRARFKKEVAESQRIREQPGVKGWEGGGRVDLYHGPDTDGKRIERKPTLDQLDGERDE